MSSPSATVRSRGEQFTPKLGTKITEEIASESNPYQAKQVRIHGYDHATLTEKCELSDVIYLLFKGELPDPKERELFRKLCVALINPGPRHPATQASITAGVGKTMTVNILPIALSIFGGKFDGASEVEEAMRYFRRKIRTNAAEQLNEFNSANAHTIPGYGKLYGSYDPYAEKLLMQFTEDKSLKVLRWSKDLHFQLKQHGIGILRSGLCAATLADLGFQPRQGNALLQLFAAPGLLAHGLEYSNKPLTSMLFEPDECYEIEEDNPS